MSNANRKQTATPTTTFRPGPQTFPKPKTTISYDPSHIPTPEPRGKFSHLQQSSNITGHVPPSRDEEGALKSRQGVELVNNVKKHHEQQETPPEPTYRENQKRASFSEAPPIELAADEGVGSPTNTADCYEHEELADEYDEDEEDYDGASEQADELAYLSRQSMVPLHELIAYYQYIQQGNNVQNIKAHKDPVSRQSSSASQQTTKTKRSLSEDVTDNDPSLTKDAFVESVESETVATNEENPESTVTRVQIPQVQVENVDEILNDDVGNQSVVPVVKDKRRIRANVVLELINSERDFVKHLRDVVEGYLYPARRHPEIFSGERINTIFSNIEQLYDFQRKFLDILETCINWDDLATSEVGQCFLDYESGFSVYHHYCNNHPNATSELQELYTKPRFVKFFEACRLLQNMIDISLDGFLLTPIQKICKYPLQLNELLKNTDENHPDFSAVSNALESMRNCANLANERKRRIEALADVMSFQERVENWFGPKLSDTSSILIHSGEVSKMTSHTWSQGVQLYLFDHLLLYSKKDLLKRNSLILKGRICMDTVTEISDAEEYKKKSFKLYCSEQQKWFVFTTRSEKEKDEWMKAFERERNLIRADEDEGFQITQREIGVAKRALQNRKHSRSARYRHKRPDTTIVDQLDIDDANTIMNRTLSLPSCIHPSHVMNFVEDSRIITSTSRTKKSSSPSSVPRSPNSSVQHLADSETSANQAQHHSSGSWFRKMGSKKLSRSQVYTLNGSGSSSTFHGSSSKQSNTMKTRSRYSENESLANKSQEQHASGSTFETTLVLSSGRVVTVREDAV